MSNKLMSVIIENPCQKSGWYRSRDALITLSSLGLWGLVIAKLYLFLILGDAVLIYLVESMMLKIVLVGFVVTFLTFHCWALYNQHRHSRFLKRQQHYFQQPTLALESDGQTQLEHAFASGHTLREREHIGTPRQAIN